MKRNLLVILLTILSLTYFSMTVVAQELATDSVAVSASADVLLTSTPANQVEVSNLPTTVLDGIEWTDVKNASEFAAAIRASHSGNIRLTGDIDLSSTSGDTDDYMFDFTFSGKISGMVIKNEKDTITYRIKNSPKTLFENLENATISDMFVLDSKFTGRDLSSGMIADDASGSTFKNLVISGVSAVGSSSLYDCDDMGIVVGHATSGCSFNGIFITDCTITSDGWDVGLVAGEAEGCTFNKCFTSASCAVWADGSSYAGADPNAYTGGICGYAKDCTITNSTNSATVMSDDDCTGGICGEANGTTIEDCNNAGLLKSCTLEGFGRMERQSAANSLLIAGGTTLLAWMACDMIASKLAVYKTTVEANNAQIIAESNEKADAVYAEMQTHNYTGSAIDKVNQWRALNEQMIQYQDQALAAQSAGQWVSNLSIPVAILGAFAPSVLVPVAAGCVCASAVLNFYNVLDTPDKMGGIAGYVEGNSVVKRCVNYGPIQCGDSDAGGIVGYLNGATVLDCFNRGIVKTALKEVGGIVGYCNGGTIRRCLNTATASSNAGNKGNIYGDKKGDCEIQANYYIADALAVVDDNQAFTMDWLPSGEAAMYLNQQCYVDGEHLLWTQDLDNDFFPTINANASKYVSTHTSNPNLVQKVYTLGDFCSAVSLPEAQMSLQNDIDMNNFFMLSTEVCPFMGTIEGNGHTLYNVSFECAQSDNNTSSSSSIPGHNEALFPWAMNATFHNFVIDNFHITQPDETLKGTYYNQALLVGTSNGCTYDSITVRNSDIALNADKDHKQYVGALAANSTSDHFSYCTVESTCKMEGSTGWSDTNIGGLVGQASKTRFDFCHNAGSVWGDDSNEGGICGYADGCTFSRCLNTGKITGQEYVGGIVGGAKNPLITMCVNTGRIDDDESKGEEYHGGLAGLIDGSSSTITESQNYGTVNPVADSNCGALYGHISDDQLNDGTNYWYCNYGGQHVERTASKIDYATTIPTGKYANEKSYLYQHIDNDTCFTDYPIPLPVAGEVYKNYLCDDSNTLKYSNFYHGAQGHTTVASMGVCEVCGRHLDEVPDSIKIGSAIELKQLAYAVHNGVNYVGKKIVLTNDIDMSNVSDFMPIGLNADHPFLGTFNGWYHRIKNLHMSRTADNTGLFGCVSGHGTYIENLIIDSSCSFQSSGNNTAALIGYVTMSTLSENTYYVHVNHCGNEANVVGNKRVAGLVGSVNENADNGDYLKFFDCYNTGTVYGTDSVAAICSNASRDGLLYATRCWNAGKVTGADENKYMFNHYKDLGPDHDQFVAIYEYDALPAEEKASNASFSDLANGKLCYLMQTTGTVNAKWGQNLGTDLYPTFYADGSGLYHERNMSNDWGTVVLPYAIKSNTSVQLYKIKSCDTSDINGTLKLTAVDEVEANTPCFFKKLSTTDNSICLKRGSNTLTINTGTDSLRVTQETIADGWSIVGNYAHLSDLTDVYYIANNKLWYAEEPITVAPYRAYLTYNGGSTTAKSLAIFVDEGDESTQIGEISADGKVTFFDDAVYNLVGQRVSKNTKGIVIKNGKKYIVK